MTADQAREPTAHQFTNPNLPMIRSSPHLPSRCGDYNEADFYGDELNLYVHLVNKLSPPDHCELTGADLALGSAASREPPEADQAWIGWPPGAPPVVDAAVAASAFFDNVRTVPLSSISEID